MTDYNISSGVTSSGVTLNTGDIETVFAGGIASSTVINGGSEIISSGGTAFYTTVSAGTETILSGGVARFTTISGGGLQDVDGDKYCKDRI